MAERKGNTLEIYEGITEHSSRVALKGVFSAFGDVLACWVPPVDRRGIDNASVRFASAMSAEAAKQACDQQQVFFQGLPLKVKYRVGGGPRVGNSDVGNIVGGNSPSRQKKEAEQRRGRASRSRDRRRSGSRGRGRGRSRGRNDRRGRSRSRSRDRRSRSRDKKKEEGAVTPAQAGVPESEVYNPIAMPGVTAAGPPQAGMMAMSPPPSTGPVPMMVPHTGAMSDRMPFQSVPGEDCRYVHVNVGGTQASPPTAGAPTGFQMLEGQQQTAMEQMAAQAALAAQHAAAQMEAAKSVVDVEAEERRRKELQAKKAMQMKRGPGVAALVQGALKRANEESQLRKDEEDVKKKEIEREEAQRRAILEQKQREEQMQKEKEEKARQEKEAVREREKRHKEEAEKERKRREAREERIKAGLEAARKQAEAEMKKKKQAKTDNLYGDMPEPDLDTEAALNAHRMKEAATQRQNLHFGLPPEDRSKIVFLDVDGVLRPARAGGFDILSVDGEKAVRADTSDFFHTAMAALRHIIERTGAVIVLSSEWRRNEALRKAVDDVLEANRLRRSIACTTALLEREVGTGDLVKSFAERRAREISQWLREHESEVVGWVVLDDINLAVADEDRKASTKCMGPKLVQTWPLCGLTMGNAKTAVRILNGEMIHKVLVERPLGPKATVTQTQAQAGAATPMPNAGASQTAAVGMAGVATPVPTFAR